MRSLTALLAFAVCTAFTLSANAGDEPTPLSIIDRALKAGGGAEKISQFKAMSFTGKITADKTSMKVSALLAGPSLFRINFATGKKDAFVIVAGGDTIWIKQGKESFREHRTDNVKNDNLDIGTLLQLFYGATLPDQLLTLKSKDYTLSFEGESIVHGVRADAVLAKHRTFPDAKIYFDKETGLPVKSFVKSKPAKMRDGVPDEQDAMTIEYFFDDYKEISGVRHFTKLKIRMDDQILRFDFDELTLHKTVDPGAFKNPNPKK